MDVIVLDTTMKLIEDTEFGNKAGKFLNWGKESLSKVAGYRALQR